MAKKKASAGRPSGGWVKVKSGGFPDTWRPVRRGDSIEGSVVSIRSGNYGLIYRIRMNDGKVNVLPNHAVLMSRLEDASVKAGDALRVIATSIGSTTKGDYFDYDVFVKRTSDAADDVPF